MKDPKTLKSLSFSEDEKNLEEADSSEFKEECLEQNDITI